MTFHVNISFTNEILLKVFLFYIASRKLLHANYNLLSHRLLYDRKLSRWLQSYVHEYVNFSVSRSFFNFGVKQFFHVLLIFQWY